MKWINNHTLQLIILLTNGTSRLMHDLSNLEIENRFFKIFDSAEVGICKPDTKIFHHVVTRLGCNPSKILFVDDSISNLETARDFGLVTHYNRPYENFKNFTFNEVWE